VDLFELYFCCIFCYVHRRALAKFVEVVHPRDEKIEAEQCKFEVSEHGSAAIHRSICFACLGNIGQSYPFRLVWVSLVLGYGADGQALEGVCEPFPSDPVLDQVLAK